MVSLRYGIKCKSTSADAAALKLLRQFFPNTSLAALRAKVQAHDYIYLTDAERSHMDGEKHLVTLLRAFDQAGIETELFEEHRDTPSSWQARPMSRELLRNAVRQSVEIKRQTLTDIEQEVEGFVSPEAMADIEAEISEDQAWEQGF